MATLEDLIGKLIVSLDANTAAHKGSAGAKAGTTTAATTKTDTAKTTPAVKFEAVKAAALKVKEKSGQPVAKKIIAEHGKAESLNQVKPENHAALLAAFEAHLAAEEGGDEGGGDEDL